MNHVSFAHTTRVVIENLHPCVDGGRFPVKRIVNDTVEVQADVFVDGHDELAAVVLYRHKDSSDWQEVPMQPLGNDLWQGKFHVTRIGDYLYTIQAWIDDFKTWRTKLAKRVDAGQDTTVDLQIGAALLESAAARAPAEDATLLQTTADTLRAPGPNRKTAEKLALSTKVLRLASHHADRAQATTFCPELHITVDRPKAQFSAWYEMFPRSCSPVPGQHGSFKDCEEWLPYIAGMGFDVLYFPPIHPIGMTSRKGRNNAVSSVAGDPGTPWAIGSSEGGHKSIHSSLGTMKDFRSLVKKAAALNLEIAMDIALQCSPDHPYVKEHPSWFRWRPDGTVQYAENPPKKYQDIFPLEFCNDESQALREELRSIFQFWIDQGVRVFRVDNPHTKPFAFWEWLISSLKAEHPDLIFLAEAFTRPKVMYQLAKLGFTQSYTYFTWRRTKQELVEYLTQLTTTEVREFFRPNFWPNTPDILMDYLQQGGRPAFMSRLVMAATLSSDYGIYGPAFELCVNKPREEGSEEYLDSEKYELKHWPIDSPDSIKDLITRVNSIRHQCKALQQTSNLRFEQVDNDMLLAYIKWDERMANVVLIVVNMDPIFRQSGWVTIDLAALGIPESAEYQVHDVLNEKTYTWSGPTNYVALDPSFQTAHIFELVLDKVTRLPSPNAKVK
ncbi:MAG: alpha-1,4-glucan--maltose-1-phosphate maltosyltransferase [Dehalococcoidia bacterium]|nr:alpha-1,4-glucan--maltose-1-phosphate maltosyltransferase [Dehalococcoidia bacterium]